MNNRKVILAFLCILFLQSSICHSQGKDASLLVAPYPGSISEPYPAEKGERPLVPLESRLQAFFTKDSFEKVKAHYTKSLGAFEPAWGENTAIYHAVIAEKDVRDYLSKHGVEMGEATDPYIRGTSAGVTIYGKPQSYNVTVHDVLDALQSAYLMKFNGVEPDMEGVMKHMEDPELKKALAKYDHVQWELFPMTKTKPMDQVIADKHYANRQDSLSKEAGELTKKMTDLMTAGKFDEATKVGDRMTEISNLQTDYKYNWDIAIKCLDEMEANAYPTKIVIDKKVEVWDLSGYPK